MYRHNRFLLITTASLLAWLSLLASGALHAQNSPPISGSWNIAPTGKAESSGELLFRLTPPDGADSIELSVPVSSGSNETGVANSIRRSLSTQVGNGFDVQAGQGANVLVTHSRGKGFSLELLDSDVDNLRVVVSSTTPVAPPTVPSQNVPANPPLRTPAPVAPGDASPAEPAPARPSAPPDAPPNATGGAGAPASAPPPPPGTH